MKQCRWCNSSVKIGLGPDHHPSWKRWKCDHCSAFGYVNDPSLEELSLVYECAWEDSGNSGRFAAGSTTENISESLLSAVKWSPSGCKCLDYGGGKGRFAKSLIQKGCKDLTVYEPFGPKPNGLSANWIDNIMDLGDEKFDWIFMIEVIEHLLVPQRIFSTPMSRNLSIFFPPLSWCYEYFRSNTQGFEVFQVNRI